MTGVDPTVRPRATHLLEYLKAVRDPKEHAVCDIAYYQDWWWTADPNPTRLRGTSAGDGSWLGVFKVVSTPLAALEAIKPVYTPRRYVAPVGLRPDSRNRFPGELEGADEIDLVPYRSSKRSK